MAVVTGAPYYDSCIALGKAKSNIIIIMHYEVLVANSGSSDKEKCVTTQCSPNNSSL